MGLDCTVFVLEDFGKYVAASFRLRRANFDLFFDLEGTSLDMLQLPHGGWCDTSDQIRDSIDDLEDRELGWLHEDPYGASLRCYDPQQLKEVDGPDFNRAVFKFVAEHYADRKVVLFWS